MHWSGCHKEDKLNFSLPILFSQFTMTFSLPNYVLIRYPHTHTHVFHRHHAQDHFIVQSSHTHTFMHRKLTLKYTVKRTLARNMQSGHLLVSTHLDGEGWSPYIISPPLSLSLSSSSTPPSRHCSNRLLSIVTRDSHHITHHGPTCRKICQMFSPRR